MSIEVISVEAPHRTAPPAATLGAASVSAPRRTRSPSDVQPAAADFLGLLADPTRRRIFLLIMRGERCNCELAEELDLPQNLVSHHLSKLREARLVREHRDLHDGRWIHFTVNPVALRTAWDALTAAFGPDSLGSRAPACHQRAERSSAMTPEAACRLADASMAVGPP
jgi:DNA-binding transcriptional ArsR family regulator